MSGWGASLIQERYERSTGAARMSELNEAIRRLPKERRGKTPRRPSPAAPRPEPLFRTKHVTDLLGCTSRELQIWGEAGYIAPVRRKVAGPACGTRFYSRADIAQLRAMIRLRQCGVGPKIAGESVRGRDFLTLPYHLFDGKNWHSFRDRAAMIALGVECSGPVVIFHSEAVHG